MIRGSATSDEQFAYFTAQNSTSIYRYEWITEGWEELPPCPCTNSGLALVNGELTAVGGLDRSSHCTNKVYTLVRQRQWTKKYPLMCTRRSSPAVITTSNGNSFVVIGGQDGVGGSNWITGVELFQVETRRWYQLTHLPHALAKPSATICYGQLHVIGIDAKGYSCSLQDIPSRGEPPRTQVLWKPLPLLPVTESTAATLCGELVLISGWKSESLANSIHQLVDGQWVDIGSLDTSKEWCLVASRPSFSNSIMIVGGWGTPHRVEECVAL